MKIHASECLSHSNYRRIYAAMVIPLQIDGTTKWDGSSASSMDLKTLYAALLILVMERPLPAINALPKTFLNSTERCIFICYGYFMALIMLHQ